MAYILKRTGKTPNVPFQHFICDTLEDMDKIDLRGTLTKVPMGSTCYVIDTGAIYFLNGQDQWIKKPSSGGSGGGDEPEPEPPTDNVIIYDGGDVHGYQDEGFEDTILIYDGGDINGY